METSVEALGVIRVRIARTSGTVQRSLLIL